MVRLSYERLSFDSYAQTVKWVEFCIKVLLAMFAKMSFTSQNSPSGCRERVGESSLSREREIIHKTTLNIHLKKP